MQDKLTDILLVEDNPSEAKLTIMCLQEHDLAQNLVHVDDGAEALDFLLARGAYADREDKTNPKVVLLDLNLPKVGGLEVLKQMKENERTKNIPVVILSSSSQDKDVIEGYNLGVNSYVVKPMDFDRFTKAIGDLGSYWMLLNEASVLLMMAKSRMVNPD
jgi:two-component system response regulator